MTSRVNGPIDGDTVVYSDPKDPCFGQRGTVMLVVKWEDGEVDQLVEFVVDSHVMGQKYWPVHR